MPSHHGAPTPYTEEALAITARNVRFDWSGVPLQYVPGD